MVRYYCDTSDFETLRGALARHKSDVLKEIAKLFVKKPPQKKGDRIDVIVKALAGDKLAQHWDKLDALSKAAIAEVAHGWSDSLDLERFVAKYGAKPPRRTETYDLGRYTRTPWTFLDAVLVSNTMPKDLQERFRAFVPPPQKDTVATVDELPESVPFYGTEEQATLQISETEQAALHDVIAVLRLADADKLRVSATTKRPTLGAAKAVQDVLRDGDFVSVKDPSKADQYMRAFAWPLLLQSAGLARNNGAKLELTKAGRAALTAPPHETIKRIWERWIDKGLIDEFNRIDAIKGQNRKGRGGLTAVADRRDDFRFVFLGCPVDAWIDIDEFFRFAQSGDIKIEVTRDPWNLYIGEAHYGSLGYDGYHPWAMIQGRYCMVLLWEYAATLGMVDIAHVPAAGARNDFTHTWGGEDLDALSRYDGLKFFRITALGAYCLGLAEEYTPKPREARPVLKVLPNREVVVQDAAAFTTADALFLERIAAKNGDHTWVLDELRLLDALEGGIRAEEIYGYFDALGHAPMPENIRQFIDDTVKRSTMVAAEGPAEVFCTVDEATALLIAHDSTAKTLCYLAGKNRLVVFKGDVAAFRRALRQLGFVVLPEI